MKLLLCIAHWQQVGHQWLRSCAKLAAISLCAFVDTAASQSAPLAVPAKSECLPEGGGFLRARITGEIQAELDWHNSDTECRGDARPDSGVRMRFSHAFGKGEQRLVLVFGIPSLREGASATAAPVNVTVIREGAGKFYGTRGDDKCTIDQLSQHTIAGSPFRNRSYRITARGFCTQPARAVAGAGSIFISRFDFAGRVDFFEEDAPATEPVVAKTVTSK